MSMGKVAYATGGSSCQYQQYREPSSVQKNKDKGNVKKDGNVFSLEMRSSFDNRQAQQSGSQDVSNHTAYPKRLLDVSV